LLWRRLSGRKLRSFKFSRQMPVGPYFADFLCREARLIVEIDGASHDSRQNHDQRRDAYMRSEDYTVLRFTDRDIAANIDGVLQAISAALEATSPPPTPPASGRGDKGVSTVGSAG
jgi:very-short-patch-repair endonuclease